MADSVYPHEANGEQIVPKRRVKPAGTKVTAYRLKRPDGSGWMHAGVEIDEVLNTIRCELESQHELRAEERGEIQIVAYETTQEEIDALPEFEGW